jgi:hypothetical protein
LSQEVSLSLDNGKIRRNPKEGPSIAPIQVLQTCQNPCFQLLTNNVSLEKVFAITGFLPPGKCVTMVSAKTRGWDGDQNDISVVTIHYRTRSGSDCTQPRIVLN